MKLYDIIEKQVSKETGVELTDVKKIYNSFWRYIKKTIETLPMKDEKKDEEDILKMRPSFFIPKLGSINYIKNSFKYYKERREKDDNKEGKTIIYKDNNNS